MNDKKRKLREAGVKIDSKSQLFLSYHKPLIVINNKEEAVIHRPFFEVLSLRGSQYSTHLPHWII